MRLVPMDLCCVNRTIYEAYGCDASQFSPTPLAIDLLKSPAIANPATHGNGLDRSNIADKLEVHEIEIRGPELPTVPQPLYSQKLLADAACEKGLILIDWGGCGGG